MPWNVKLVLDVEKADQWRLGDHLHHVLQVREMGAVNVMEHGVLTHQLEHESDMEMARRCGSGFKTKWDGRPPWEAKDADGAESVGKGTKV